MLSILIRKGGPMKNMRMKCKASFVMIVLILAAVITYGNGGPFVVKYPNGDPSAKGVLAKMDYTLHPAREMQLRVVKEDLSFRFAETGGSGGPLVSVAASYTIENPTKKEISVDFGFPILRGIYMPAPPFIMEVRWDTGLPKPKPPPGVKITVEGKDVKTDIISNSAIYGIIRQFSRDSIEEGIKNNSALAQLVSAVRKSSGLNLSDRRIIAKVQKVGDLETISYDPPANSSPTPTAENEPAREELRGYLIKKQRWNDRDAALFVEYTGLDFGPMLGNPYAVPTSQILGVFNIGALQAIGAQKATQFFAQIASHFDKNAAETYESIFSAWGGDVSDRSVDLESGNVRLREIDIKNPQNQKISGPANDQTIYARVDYLDPYSKINETEKAACTAILKNLPVVFTFAPMNLLRYHLSFAPQTTQNVTVAYAQYAYLDTKGIPSFQLAYVLHPASLWNDFGPIHIQVQTPKGVACRASVPLLPGVDVSPAKAFASPTVLVAGTPAYYPIIQYEAHLKDRKDKMGELFLAVSKNDWERFTKEQTPAKAIR
jgi:hypothetical protein